MSPFSLLFALVLSGAEAGPPYNVDEAWRTRPPPDTSQVPQVAHDRDGNPTLESMNRVLYAFLELHPSPRVHVNLLNKIRSGEIKVKYVYTEAFEAAVVDGEVRIDPATSHSFYTEQAQILVDVDMLVRATYSRSEALEFLIIIDHETVHFEQWVASGYDYTAVGMRQACSYNWYREFEAYTLSCATMKNWSRYEAIDLDFDACRDYGTPNWRASITAHIALGTQAYSEELFEACLPLYRRRANQ